ncbi:PREDICTED: anosmin-1 [Nicrophorus vespilloides]|uniref:Anosmin-1 n=1 Tax=Nicrophorus vespilloides TaxID=110193 RepID=A0ABM1MN81_NICVS|nr:PREDICTED: anosmin-1 [Nicrophorus vespilloides]
MVWSSSVVQHTSVLLLLLVAAQLATTVLSGRHRPKTKEYEHYDVLIVATCEAKCWDNSHRNVCVKSCLQKGSEKPGACPNLLYPEGSTLSPFAAVCMNTCKVDTDCPKTTKCCRHKCGITCQSALNLNNAPGLPELPSDIVIRARKKRSLFVEWKAKKVSANRVLYVIEERHHPGKYFTESHMGEWNLCYRSTKAGALLKHIVRPGRWYQFRIAAVNTNGTKGFSDPIQYIAQAGPKPPKAPQSVIVGPLWTINGSLHAELKWTPPYSDLPIQKYKVFWSRRLHGATALDSVLVLQQTVPKDQTHFIINNLEMDSLYFLQVQALVQYGKEILRGEKSGLILNTTYYSNATENLIHLNPQSPRRVEDLQLQKLFWSQGDLKARIVWKAKSSPVKYTIVWWSGPCKSNNDHYAPHLKLAATTKGSHFDIYDLQFECRYRVSVRETAAASMKTIFDTSVTFTTPSCKELQSRHKRTKCNRRL